MARTIPLTQGKVAIVDAADYERLVQWKWHAMKNRRNWYVVRKERLADGKKRNIYMHREVLRLNYGDGEKSDHINGDGLDNRRANLRQATHAQNQRNSRKQLNNTSGYMGVSWHKQSKRWEARIVVDGKRIHLGLFDDPVDGARAYDDAVIKYHGEFATKNKAGGDDET